MRDLDNFNHQWSYCSHLFYEIRRGYEDYEFKSLSAEGYFSHCRASIIAPLPEIPDRSPDDQLALGISAGLFSDPLELLIKVLVIWLTSR